MRSWIALLGGLLLAGCATEPPLAPPQPLFADARFEAPAEPVDVDGIFAVSPSMQQYLDTEIALRARRHGGRDGLVEALYTKSQLKLQYDASTTRSAAQAFDSRSGNCLSLVIMTAAFATQLGLPVEFNQVFIEEAWDRSGDLMLANGHVNLTLGHRIGDTHLRLDAAQSVIIDFLPPEETQHQRSRTIPRSTILAMYANNRAAETLAAGDVNQAYWWARAAIEHEPTFLIAHNTLAVIYLRHGDADLAQQALAQVLAREPENTSALANLVHVYEVQGRPEDAKRMAERLARIEPTPPFHWFNRGLEALQRRDYAAAREYFRKEVNRAAYYHEFHFGLALANFGLGDIGEARRELALAMESSTTQATRQLYAAKLERLRARRVQ